MRAANEARCARLLDRSALLEHDDLDWATVPDTEIDADVLACLVYMRDVEGFVDRDLVGVTAHRTTLADPLLRRFLHVWRAEEREHARALERFLDRYAERGAVIPSRQLPPPPVARPAERVIARIGGPVGAVVAGAHMAWGAANELLTLTGYRLLAERCGHPTLGELLTRIAAQESRHFSFYLLQAEWRLAASRTVRTALRRVLERSWTPVGIGEGYKTHEEFGRVLTVLADGPTGQRAIDRMDARFSALPGFEGLRIYRAAASAVPAA